MVGVYKANIMSQYRPEMIHWQDNVIDYMLFALVLETVDPLNVPR